MDQTLQTLKTLLMKADTSKARWSVWQKFSDHPQLPQWLKQHDHYGQNSLYWALTPQDRSDLKWNFDCYKMDNPQHFDSDTLAKAITRNPYPAEMAPYVVKVLAKRQAWSAIQQVLLSVARYDVKRNRSTLDRVLAPLHNPLLKVPTSVWQTWANHVNKALPHTALKHIDQAAQPMFDQKATQRGLAEYVSRLSINPKQLSKLNKQPLLLVGGGYSPLKQQLAAQGIKPVITNIDPIATQYKATVADKLIPYAFNSAQAKANLGKQKFSAIYALHSLPTYALTNDEVKGFFINALSRLKQGGKLYVTPTQGFADAFGPGMEINRPVILEETKRMINALQALPNKLFTVKRTQVEVPNKNMFKFKDTQNLQGVIIQANGPGKLRRASLRQLASSSSN
jgi:hypothetical protein